MFLKFNFLKSNWIFWNSILRPWINRATWLSFKFIRSCKVTFLIHKVSFWKFWKRNKKTIKHVCYLLFSKNVEKNSKTFRQLQITIKFVEKFSLKRSWETFSIVFCSIFPSFRKIFCKIKTLSFTSFYRNIVTWFPVSPKTFPQ